MTGTFTPADAPSSGDTLPIKDLIGSLLLLTVKKETDEIETEYGATTAIEVNIAVHDGELKGETYSDALIFQRVLKSQLRAKVGGQMVLGRLELGEKKAGKNAPYRLNETPTDDDKATARKYLAHVAVAVADSEPF